MSLRASSLSMLIAFLSGFLALSAFANPPKPSHSDETPWSEPLAEDRTTEFHKEFAGNDEVVVDKRFGWMWQTTASKNMDWYSAYYFCADSKIGGFNDWQLPSYYQLMSIIDYGRAGNYIIPSFSNVQPNSVLWSRDDSVAIDQPDYDDRWTLHIRLGMVTFEQRTEKFRALCVRGETSKREGPAGQERFVEIQKDIILDKLTNLKWTAPRNERSSRILMWTVPATYSEANGWCYNSKAGSLTEWRLPTIQELTMLLSLNRRTPASHMPKMPSSMYAMWSSTRKTEHDSFFGLYTMGQMGSNPQSEKNIFGCVHE